MGPPPGMKQTLELVNATIDRSFPLAADKMRQVYGITDEASLEGFSRDMMADGMVYGYQLWAKQHVAAGKDPTYVYLFDRAPGTYHLPMAMRLLSNRTLERRNHSVD